MPNALHGLNGVGAYDEWGVRRNQGWGAQGGQFKNPAGLLQGAVERFAGQPLPGDAGRIRDALIYGQLGAEDETGRAAVDARGNMSLQPKGQPWSVRVGPGSLELGFSTGQADNRPRRQGPLVEWQGVEQQGPEDPMAGKTPARAELETMLSTYQDANPAWYRP